jgi:hypothetical protein
MFLVWFITSSGFTQNMTPSKYETKYKIIDKVMKRTPAKLGRGDVP